VDLQIKTADAFAAHDLEGLWRVRRAARETAAFRRVLQLFVERGGPIPVEEIVGGLPDVGPEATRQALVALDADDLIRIQSGKVDVPTPLRRRPRHSSCGCTAVGNGSPAAPWTRSASRR